MVPLFLETPTNWPFVEVYASEVPLPLDEESDLDMYAAQGT